MQNNRLLIALLLVALVSVNLVTFSIVGSLDGSQPLELNPAVIVLFSLAMSQVGLLAAWASFGNSSLPWRMICLIIAVASWSGLIAIGLNSGPSLENEAGFGGSPVRKIAAGWTVLLLGQTIAVLLPLSIARLQGLRLRQEGSDASYGENGNRRSRRFQYSLAYMLSWTTALAVILGLVKYNVDYRVLPSYPTAWWDLALLSIGHGCLVLAAIQAVLRTRQAALWSVLLVLTTVAAIAGDRLTGIVPRLALWMCVLEVAWLLAILGVLRVAGYRLAR